MTSQRPTTFRFLYRMIFAIVVTCALAFLSCALAWADEDPDRDKEVGKELSAVDSTENIVNVNQMPDSSFLYNTDISELSDAESFQDTQTVQVTGEVVGDRIDDETADNMYWITLQSNEENDYSTISVLMKEEQAALIDHYGNYHTEGTELQVRGTFYLVCPEHQGLSDLHAQEVIVVHVGEEQTHSTHPAVLWAAVLALGLGLLSLFTYRYLRERRK